MKSRLALAAVVAVASCSGPSSHRTDESTVTTTPSHTVEALSVTLRVACPVVISSTSLRHCGYQRVRTSLGRGTQDLTPSPCSGVARKQEPQTDFVLLPEVPIARALALMQHDPDVVEASIVKLQLRFPPCGFYRDGQLILPP